MNVVNLRKWPHVSDKYFKGGAGAKLQMSPSLNILGGDVVQRGIGLLTGAVGIMFNGLLIWLVVCHTRKEIRLYGRALVCTAALELFQSLVHFFMMAVSDHEGFCMSSSTASECKPSELFAGRGHGKRDCIPRR